MLPATETLDLVTRSTETTNMQDLINLQSRNYIGQGTLQICSSEITDAHISIYFRNDGRHTITCWFYLTNEYAMALSNVLEKQMSTPIYAMFSGNDNYEGAKISIDKIVLNETNISADTTTTDPKYIIRHDLLLNIFSKIGKASVAAAIVSQNFLNIVRLEFIMLSNIRIQFQKLSDDESVKSSWGLTNFYFGSEGEDHLLTAGEEILSLNVNGYPFEIKKVFNYSDILSQLKFNNNVNVTCEARLDNKYGKLADFKTTLDHICMLISFADCNWVTPLYTDTYKDGIIVETILLYHKVYPFTKGRKSLINIGHQNAESSCQDFVQGSLKIYKELKANFGLHKVLEYYISSQTNGIVHERFDIAYIALECLCSSVRKYAEDNREILTISDIQETEDKLRSLLKDLNEQISEESLKTISKELSYKHVSIKDEQYFTFDRFGIKYDRKTVKELYEVRNALFHGGDFNFTKLFKRTVQLFDLLDRTILTMIGWKGMAYISNPEGIR